ncbi:MAG TPA: hypothetical protein PLQ35_10060 [bacterium]|nr:hypothetical protein [bacterium]HQL62627.1 hypothetical protein [bacterium]
MNPFLRRFLTLLIPLILDCIEEALNQNVTEEGRHESNEQSESDK